MAKQTQSNRWESPMLAAAMALTGTLFLFDKLHSLMRSPILSWHLVPYCASVLLVVLGVCLMVMQVAPPERLTAVVPREHKRGHTKEGQRER